MIGYLFVLSITVTAGLFVAVVLVARRGLVYRLEYPVVVILVLLAGWIHTPDWIAATIAVLIVAVVVHVLLITSSAFHIRRRTVWLLYSVALLVIAVGLGLPKNTDLMYQSSARGPVEERHGFVYLSRSGGEEWQQVWRSSGSEWPHSIHFAGFTKTAYLAIGHATEAERPPGSGRLEHGHPGLLKSTDSGRTWGRLKLPESMSVAAVGAVTTLPDSPETVLIGAGPLLDPAEAAALDRQVAGGRMNPFGIYRSVDGGVNWEQVFAVPARAAPFEFVTAFAESPVDALELYAASDRHVLHSDNGGLTWDIVSGKGDSGWMPSGFPPSEPIAIYCSAGETVTIVTRRSGAFTSTDAGVTWRPVGERPSTASFHSASPVLSTDCGSDRNPDEGMVVAGDSGLWRSCDAGSTWTLSRANRPNNRLPYSAVAVDPQDYRYLLAAPAPFTAFVVSFDAGKTWTTSVGVDQDARLPDGPLEITDVVFAGDGESVYASTADYLCKTKYEPVHAGGAVLASTDRGETWKVISGDRFAEASILDVAVGPESSGVLYAAGSNGVTRSNNAGASWEALVTPNPESGPSGSSCVYRSVVVDPHNADRILIAGDNRGILLSDDRGRTWRTVDGISAEGSVVAQIAFAGQANGAVYALDYNRAGYYVSKDSGESWDFHPVHGMRRPTGFLVPTQKPLHSNVYMTTDGAGIYRIGPPHERVGPPVGNAQDACALGPVHLITDAVGGLFVRDASGGSWEYRGARAPKGDPRHDGPTAVCVLGDELSSFYTGYEASRTIQKWQFDDDRVPRLQDRYSLPDRPEHEYTIVRDIAVAPGASHRIVVATEEVTWRGPPSSTGNTMLNRALPVAGRWAYRAFTLAALIIGLYGLLQPRARPKATAVQVCLLGLVMLPAATDPVLSSSQTELARSIGTVYAAVPTLLFILGTVRSSPSLVRHDRLARTLISRIQAPVLVVDFNGSVIAANAGAGAVFHCGAETLTGAPLEGLIADVNRAHLSGVSLQHLAEDNQSLRSQCRYGDEASLDCVLSFSYLKSRDGRHFAYIISVTQQHGVQEPETRFGFTGREMEVLRLLIQGLSYREIAERLFISVPTVKTHAHSIYSKSGAQNRLHLARLLE